MLQTRLGANDGWHPCVPNRSQAKTSLNSDLAAISTTGTIFVTAGMVCSQTQTTTNGGGESQVAAMTAVGAIGTEQTT